MSLNTLGRNQARRRRQQRDNSSMTFRIEQLDGGNSNPGFASFLNRISSINNSRNISTENTNVIGDHFNQYHSEFNPHMPEFQNLPMSGNNFESGLIDDTQEGFRNSGITGLRDRLRRTIMSDRTRLSSFSRRRRLWGRTRGRGGEGMVGDRSNDRQRLSSRRRERRERSRAQTQADAAGLFRINNMSNLRLSKDHIYTRVFIRKCLQRMPCYQFSNLRPIGRRCKKREHQQ